MSEIEWGVWMVPRPGLSTPAVGFDSPALHQSHSFECFSRFHLACAASCAIFFRLSGDICFARACPPARAITCLSFCVSNTSPVAMRATLTAHPTTSPGLFCPWGPLGMSISFYAMTTIIVSRRLLLQPLSKSRDNEERKISK